MPESTTNTHQVKSTPHIRHLTISEDLMKKSMALRSDFEARHSSKNTQGVSSPKPILKTYAKKPSYSTPFVPFSQELPTPNVTPTQGTKKPQTPFASPRRSASSYMTAGNEDMTPAQSPKSSGDDDEDEEAELELSVGRLGLGRDVNGGNSPANERVESEKDLKPGTEPSMKTGYEMSLEDQAVLERAAAILRGQVRHFEQEIKANINQRKIVLASPILRKMTDEYTEVKDLYRDSLDPPDIADMDSMPDFHIRQSPHAPNAIVKSVQVCCAVERGLAAILEVQRATGKEKNGGEAREESLMEICVRRPSEVSKEMQSAVNGIAKTVGYGGREKRGDSVEWKV